MMEPFGPFQVIREIDAAGGATVYKAQKEGDHKGEYVVKVFSLERLFTEESTEVQSELDPLFKDIGASFTSRINLQKKAAESSPCFVPILAAGHDERGAWYAANFYARSVKGMLDRFVALESRDLFHLIQSVVKAARHLKQTCGRPHGNLKPSNIFIDGTGKPRSSRVVVSDPLPGDEHDAANYELADLRAIGELIYQLVLRRKVDFSTGWVILPVEASREWTELFGNKTADWLSLCNKLLAPKLSLDQYNLEQLATDLPRLKPKRSPIIVAAPVAVALLVAAGLAMYFHWLSKNYGTLVVATDPPGATVNIIPLNDYGGEDLEHAQKKTTPSAPAARPRPLKLSVRQGQYRLIAEYDAENGAIKSRPLKVSIEPRRTTMTNLYLPHGTLAVVSEPAGATLTFGGRTQHTPYTNLYVKPGDVSIELKLANYLPRPSSRAVPTNGMALISETLERIQAGRVNVTFSSDPPGGIIRLDNGPPHPAPWITGLEDGRQYAVTAELNGWEPETRHVQYAVRDGVNRTNEFVFQYGTLRIAETDPAGAEVVLDGRSAGNAPLDIPVPLIEHNLTLRAEGFSNYTASVSVPGHKQIFRVADIKLQPIEGLIRFLVDPPVAGVEIVNRLTGKVLAQTTPDELRPVRALPPTNYDLVANHAYLGRVQKKATAVAGKTTQASFEFPYGTVVFSDIQPEDAGAGAEIVRSGQPAVKVSEPVYQRPGEGVVYLVKAPGYQNRYFTNAVSAHQTNRMAVTLARVAVPVQLESLPPGVEFYRNGSKLEGAGPEYSLTWGPAELVARHPRLGAITNQVEIRWNGPNPIPAFKFDYGTVMLTNLPEDVLVKEGSEALVVQPGPVRLAYERPGSHTYDLYESGQKVDSLTTNLTSGGSIMLQSEVATREFRNSLGMRFAKVANLFGPGKDGWVGKYEVTQQEYQQVMGDNPSARKLGGDYPVENVNWVQATEFCQKLTQRDTRPPPGLPGRYSLPTWKQWQTFEEGADLTNAVYATTQPARVGSKGPSNKFGVSDVLGNVREWLDSDDPKNKDHVGGGFRTRPSFGGMAAFLNPQQLQLDKPSDDLGFRVIWVPNQ